MSKETRIRNKKGMMFSEALDSEHFSDLPKLIENQKKIENLLTTKSQYIRTLKDQNSSSESQENKLTKDLLQKARNVLNLLSGDFWKNIIKNNKELAADTDSATSELALIIESHKNQS